MTTIYNCINELKQTLNNVQDSQNQEIQNLRQRKAQIKEILKEVLTEKELERHHAHYRDAPGNCEDGRQLGDYVVSSLSQALWSIKILTSYFNGKRPLPSGETVLSIASEAMSDVIEAMECFDVVAQNPNLNQPNSEERRIMVKYFKLVLKTAIILGRLIAPGSEEWWEEWSTALHKDSATFDFNNQESFKDGLMLDRRPGAVSAVNQMISQFCKLTPTGKKNGIDEITDNLSA
jgi:hypothetical protein